MARNNTPLLLLLGAGGAILALAASSQEVRDAVQETVEDAVDLARETIARISKHEGTYSSTNLNTDGNGLSWGMLQWAQGTGDLGVLLGRMSSMDSARFRATFGDYSNQLLLVTGARDRAERLGPVGGHLLWGDVWAPVFKEAGRDPIWQRCQQIQAENGPHWKAAVESAKVLGVITQRSLALTFDTAVQQGPSAALKWAGRVKATSQPGEDILAAFATAVASQFWRSAPPVKSPTDPRLRWVSHDDGYHLYSGKVDLYVDVSRRRRGVLTDGSLSDVPVTLV